MGNILATYGECAHANRVAYGVKNKNPPIKKYANEAVKIFCL
jgi:hypothetical protein